MEELKWWLLTGLIIGVVFTYISYGTLWIGIIPFIYHVSLWGLPFIFIPILIDEFKKLMKGG